MPDANAAAKEKKVKRGVKEVVKAIRKKQGGCVWTPAHIAEAKAIANGLFACKCVGMPVIVRVCVLVQTVHHRWRHLSDRCDFARANHVRRRGHTLLLCEQ